ncbi:hypothetical protein B0O99DRAFT_537965 [Bisporella sp. PMI_857]|nr:hypothetical protein B0O99DRAFT_537965 [Bisporella sp. PMI_857]
MAPEHQSKDATPQSSHTVPTELRREDTHQVRASKDGPAKLHRRRLHRPSISQGRQHVHLGPSSSPRPVGSSIYMGSYSHSPRHSRVSLGGYKTPGSSAPASPRMSMSQSHLESLLHDLDLNLETYGVEELRDGFFDASFFKPPKTDHDDLMRQTECTLPAAFQKRHPLSPKDFLPKQWNSIKSVVESVATTRAGIKLSKSFLPFFIAYILCLVPIIRTWLGRYNYVMVLSTLLNHPGRTIGAQLDGFVLTTMGSATGLGWGAFALWLSESTAATRRGYGGILAMILVLFMGILGALRSYYIRVYQFVLCAGIAINYACLADASDRVHWGKMFDFGIPWVCGQAICLAICCTVAPDAGARPLAVSLHDAFKVMDEGLRLPQPKSLFLHRQLSWTFVQISQAYRDLVLDVSLTRFKPSDVMALRNLIQGVIRSLLALKMENQPLDEIESDNVQAGNKTDGAADTSDLPSSTDEIVINIDDVGPSPLDRTNTEDRAVKLIITKLGSPTYELLSCMRASLARCDAVLMDMSGYRKYLGPDGSTSSDILGALTEIRKTMIKYDQEEETLLENPELPPTYSNHKKVVEIFLFVHPIRQAASSVEKLMVKVMEMQQKRTGWKMYLPSYPLAKASQRTNAQVRHDRGGVTAGFYFRSQAQLARTMRGMANVYKPLPRHVGPAQELNEKEEEISRMDTMGRYEAEEEAATNRNNVQTSRQKRLRYKLWLIIHRLQGFETRFALKVALSTSLLSVPAWLDQSREWWNINESWWAVISVWIMMHPRVGGNFQDLVTRGLCALLGAVWGGLSYSAANGNPYVMAAFAAIYMIPMIFRYTQSSHPRSGIVGCISFTVVSLSVKTAEGSPSVAHIAWTRGVAFIVGVVAAVIINWVLWPFVARHELRKALSATMIYSSIIYRGVVAKYVYYEAGHEPNQADMERSEMLEGRLREGFVRIRQLMALTRHEIRLRGPFNPLPYSALIDACERFFDYLVAVRQSSMFFHPHYLSDNEQAAESLLAYRRDAVAAILMNLYVLAGALRGDRKVPRYLPSAAAARKRLLDHMVEIEAQQSQEHAKPSHETQEKQNRRWQQIYSYSYSQSLTGCVQQLEQLQKYTKEIVGEQGFEPINTTEYEDLKR